MIVTIDVKDTVASLAVKEGNVYTPIGTCFFLNLVERQRIFSYVVTNKHVVEGPGELGLDIYLSVNGSHNLGVEPFPLRPQWVYHTDTAVDLAVSPRAGISGAYPVGASAIPSDWIVTRNRLRAPLVEGIEVAYPCLSAQYPGLQRSHQVMRQGHIALIPTEPLEGRYGPATYFVVEAAAYAGNSGAPLFMPAQARDGQPALALLGVVTAPFAQQRATNLGEAVRVDGNFGLCLVTPAECLLELPQREELVDLRKKGTGAGRFKQDHPRIAAN